MQHLVLHQQTESVSQLSQAAGPRFGSSPAAPIALLLSSCRDVLGLENLVVVASY